MVKPGDVSSYLSSTHQNVSEEIFWPWADTSGFELLWARERFGISTRSRSVTRKQRDQMGDREFEQSPHLGWIASSV